MNTQEEKEVITVTVSDAQTVSDTKTFSKKKKIWFVVATLALLLLAAIFSFNMRSLCVLPQSSGVFGTQVQEFQWARKFYWDEVYVKSQGADRFFLQINTGHYRPANILQCYKMLHEAEPKNPIYLAYYAIYLAASDAKETKTAFDAAIKKWKVIDPNNGMPYFLNAYVLSKDGMKEKKAEAVKPEKKGKAPADPVKPEKKGKVPADPVSKIEFDITNPSAAAMALAEYKEGLSKKYATCYTTMAVKKKLESANLSRDPLGELQRIEIAASCIPVHLLALEQDLAYRMSVLAEMNAKKGDIPTALELVNSGKKYILLRLEKESPALINVLVYHSLCNRWLDVAKDLKFKEAEETYDKIAKDFDSWRNSNRPDQAALKKYGGVFVQTLVPSIKTDIATEEYKPERMINYLILDQYGLTALFTQLGIIIVLMALISGVFFLCKRKARWIQLSAKDYWFIGLVGVLLPLVIQLIWLHIPALSGRGVNIANNQMNINLMAKYQVFLSPLYFGILCCVVLAKKGNAKPLDCVWNLVFLLSAYLFLTTATLRIVQDIEIRHYTKQDKLIHSESGFTALEERAAKELTGKLKANLSK